MTKKRYVLEQNNPYKYTDPDGQNPVVLAYLAVVGAGGVIGALVFGVQGAIESGTEDLINQVGETGSIKDADLTRLSKQSLKGLGKGAVLGFLKGAIIAGTAGRVDTSFIDQLGLAWDISYKGGDNKLTEGTSSSRVPSDPMPKHESQLKEETIKQEKSSANPWRVSGVDEGTLSAQKRWNNIVVAGVKAGLTNSEIGQLLARTLNIKVPCFPYCGAGDEIGTIPGLR